MQKKRSSILVITEELPMRYMIFLIGLMNASAWAADSTTGGSVFEVCQQPDYEKWNQVSLKMSEDEVTKLLGVPIKEWGASKDPSANSSKILVYGRIKFNTNTLPDNFDFYVVVKQGVVIEKHDPFNGELSRDGKPSVPILITPHNKSIFSHFPRLLDLRWGLSSGNYPLTYDIEIEHAQYSLEKNELIYVGTIKKSSEIPYLAISFGGATSGRWRVMAKNNTSKSVWSEWQYFRFEK